MNGLISSRTLVVFGQIVHEKDLTVGYDDVEGAKNGIPGKWESVSKPPSEKVTYQALSRQASRHPDT